MFIKTDGIYAKFIKLIISVIGQLGQTMYIMARKRKIIPESTKTPQRFIEWKN